MRTFAALLCALAFTAAAGERSSASLASFKRANPCPATGERRGRCPGYVIDHVVPLCAGGNDSPRNMQWQTREDALRKDVEERKQCRALRRQRQ